MAKPKPKAKAPKPAGDRAMIDQREKQRRGHSGEAAHQKDEARRIAINIARPPELLGKAEQD
jgi:hypothetical protein